MPRATVVTRIMARIGAPVVGGLAYVGGLTRLLRRMLVWIWVSAVLRRVRVGRRGLYTQIVRVGVRSIGVIALVSTSIGMILALQMAPPLKDFGQTETVANIIAIAAMRELGPLISAIVLTGFAGASIAAELGAMVVGEEIEALEAHALSPVRFLVMPRVLATTISLPILCVVADVIQIASGWAIGVMLLDVPSGIYINNTIQQLKLVDFLTGLWKAGVFGLIIGSVACFNGLAVKGGAAGVGRATTWTVVLSILLIVISDLMFTTVFYRLGWT